MERHTRILVTGANGLLGRALVQTLTENGYDNIIRCTRTDCDLTNELEVNSFFSKCEPEFIFHCAGKVYGILGNMQNQGESIYENLKINTNVIEAARRCSVKKILVMGTGAVYPETAPVPLTEETIFNGLPHHSESGYAHAKRAALAMLEAYAEQYQMKWTYIVSCNLFGEYDNFDLNNSHVVPALIRKFYEAALHGKQPLVWGNGSAERDFLYVKDAAKIIIECMKNIEGAVNIGSGTTYKIRDIVSHLEKIYAVSANFDENMPNGQAYRGYNLSKIDRFLNFDPIGVPEGLKITCEWYKNKMESAERPRNVC